MAIPRRKFTPVFGLQGPTSRPLNGTYTYYKRLWADGYGKLADAVNSDIYEAMDAAIELPEMGLYFYSLAEQESKKELALLEQKFHTKLNLSSYDEGDNFATELINAVNSVMQLRSVYERNRDLIKDTNGQKQLITWFYEYFEKQWNQQINSAIQDAINAAFRKTSGSKSLKILKPELEKQINKQIFQMAQDAVVYMFSEAKKENGLKSDQSIEGNTYKDAYKKLLYPILREEEKGNRFIEGLIHSTGLDKIADPLSSNILSAAKKVGSIKNRLDDFITVDVHQVGGLALEELENYMVDFVVNKAFARNSHTIESFHTGETKMKADSIYLIDMDASKFENWLEKNTFGTREKDITAFNALNDIINDNDFKKGFIIYTNTKNWTLGNNFKGFSAGSPITLGTFSSMIAASGLPKHNSQLYTGMAMQVGKGALAESYIEQVSIMFARAVAAFLFDDFTVIGKKQVHGAQSIHLLDLNGIYTPLSFYFYLLSEACFEANYDEVRKLVSVSIDAPQILFPTQESQSNWEKSNNATPMDAWREQASMAYRETKIKVNFLKKFKQIVGQFL